MVKQDKQDFARTLENALPYMITENYPEIVSMCLSVKYRKSPGDYKVRIEAGFNGKPGEVKWRKLPELMMSDWSDNNPESLSARDCRYKETNGALFLTFAITENAR